ncbi:hypothetical protein TNCV_1126631 [Trichonephila clavipes]|nr:hypothetical protein TNCV_1126631 [Trichonephila clavipes]
MLLKDIYKIWIISDKALFHLSFTTGESKTQHISREEIRKDAALLEQAGKPSGAMAHRAHLVDEFLESEDIHQMDCPVKSSEFIRIGYAWDVLEREIATRKLPPRTI